MPDSVGFPGKSKKNPNAPVEENPFKPVPQEGMGVIIRTAGQNKSERFFDRDLHLLLQQWDEIEAKMQSQDSPAFLYEEPDLIG